tara:strand:+ start:916 stop:1797 length:882 start_codon:yes stop_codon:yes gene_type:complete
MSESTMNNQKHALVQMAQTLVESYHRETAEYLKKRLETDQKMAELSQTILDQEKSVAQGLAKIQELEETLSLKNKTLSEYEAMIRGLEDKLKEKLETESAEQESSNKFNMLRIQAKEITEKDREIERLNKLVNLLRDKQKPHKDTPRPTHDVSGGWSPTRENSPYQEPVAPVEPDTEPVEDTKDVEKQSEVIEAIVSQVSEEISDTEEAPVLVEKPGEEVTEEAVAEEQEQEQDKEVAEIFVYRKKEYYTIKGDPDKVVYQVLEGDLKGERLGTWYENTSGKRKGKRSVTLDK